MQTRYEKMHHLKMHIIDIDLHIKSMFQQEKVGYKISQFLSNFDKSCKT